MSMTEVQRKALEKALDVLASDLEVTAATIHLKSKGIFNDEDEETINAKTTHQLQVSEFVKILKRRGKKAFDIFLCYLHTCQGSKHLADELEEKLQLAESEIQQTPAKNYSKTEEEAKKIGNWLSYEKKFFMKSFLQEPDSPFKFLPNALNFVLIGKTGSGKSTTGNTLVGQDCFEESEGTNSQTKTISMSTFCEGQREITVIDTPGLFDTHKDFTNEEIMLEMVKTMIRFRRGIHLFLLVFKADMRFTEEEKGSVLEIEKILSKDIYQYSVIVLTKARERFAGRKRTKCLTSYIDKERESNGAFAHLIEKVGGRVVAVENCFEEEVVADLQRQTLLRYLMAVVEKNKGKHFSNKLFVEIDQKIQHDEFERQKRIQKTEQLSQMKYRINKLLYDYVLQSLSVKDLKGISNYFELERNVDQIYVQANLAELQYVEREDVKNALKQFVTSNRNHIKTILEMKSREIERARQQEKDRMEINVQKVGAHLPSLFNSAESHELRRFLECLQERNLTLVRGLMCQFAENIAKLKDFTKDADNIESMLQRYCLNNSDIVTGHIHAILERRSEIERIEKERAREQKQNDALAKISDVIEGNLDRYLNDKSVTQLEKMEEEIKRGEVPDSILRDVKSKLTYDDIAVLDDKAIKKEILIQIQARQSRIEEFKKKAGKCFAGSVLVQTRSNGSKSISAVKVNDEILAFDDDGNLFYEKVYLISHANATDEVLYVQITTKQGKVLFISPHHILPIGGLCKNIPAKDVHDGDTIFTINGGVFTPDIVTSVSYKICKGAFCPMTMNGNIVVNDVAASCYTTFVNPSLARILLSPFRVMFNYLPPSVFDAILPYDSGEGMPLILAVSRAAVGRTRSALKYLNLL